MDDSSEWLEKTREFLVAHNLPAQNLVTWDTFTKQKCGPFDLILYDLGSIEMRERTFKEVLGLCHPGTNLVLDDFHAIRYKLYVKRVLRESNIDYYSLKTYTEDESGRYSVLVSLLRWRLVLPFSLMVLFMVKYLVKDVCHDKRIPLGWALDMLKCIFYPDRSLPWLEPLLKLL